MKSLKTRYQAELLLLNCLFRLNVLTIANIQDRTEFLEQERWAEAVQKVEENVGHVAIKKRAVKLLR